MASDTAQASRARIRAYRMRRDEADRNMTNTASAGKVSVTLIRSTIGFDKRQLAVVRGMGLRRLNHTVVLQDVPSIRGMIHKVRHLVHVSDVGD